jgi:hypothetical protein
MNRKLVALERAMQRRRHRRALFCFQSKCLVEKLHAAAPALLRSVHRGVRVT